jgi:hypothetical protein
MDGGKEQMKNTKEGFIDKVQWEKIKRNCSNKLMLNVLALFHCSWVESNCVFAKQQ